MRADDAAATLDLCLDRFLSGQDWRSVPAVDDSPEVRQLMEVAELVFAMAQRVPPIEPRAKQRLWSRLFSRFAEARVWGSLRVEGSQPAGRA